MMCPAAAARLNNETGLIVHPLAADFRHPPEITALFAHIEQDAGGLDVLVNNAVDLAIGYSFIDTPLAVLSNAIAVNLTGVFLCSQLGARLMLRKQQGVIIHLGSITSDRVTRNRSAYVSTKGAIESLTRAMAVELGKDRIRLNCIAPDTTPSQGNTKALPAHFCEAFQHLSAEAQLQGLSMYVPCGEPPPARPNRNSPAAR